MESFHNYIGLTGTFIYLASYFLLAFGKIKAKSVAYIAMNLIAPVLCLVSLYYEFNLASTVTQLSWLAIGVGGLLWSSKNDETVIVPAELVSSEVSKQ